MTTEAKKRFLINAAFFTLIAVLFYFVMKYLLVWLLPFVIGFACALLLQKPVAFLQQKTRLPRGFWAVVLVVLLLGLLFGGVGYLAYRLYNELLAVVGNMADELPALQQALGEWNARLSGWLNDLPPRVSEALESAPAKLAETGVAFLSGLLTDAAKAVLVNTPSMLLTTLISIIACCFMTIDYNRITGFVLRQFAPANQQLLLKSKRMFTENILKMLRGYLLIMGITFLELFVGFLLIGIPYTGALALIVAVVDILPVLGTGTVLIPWGVISLAMGNTARGLELLLLYVVIAVLRNILEPKIIGTQMGLSPIVTLVAMYVGLRLFGFMGLWGLPLVVIVLVKLQEAGMVHIWKNADPPADPPSVAG